MRAGHDRRNCNTCIENVLMERIMKVYSILEAELSALGSLSVHAMAGFSMASFSLSSCLILIIDGLISPSATPIGVAVLTYGPWFFGAITLGSSIYGGIMWRKRGTIIKKIKAQSKSRPVSFGSTTFG